MSNDMSTRILVQKKTWKRLYRLLERKAEWPANPRAKSNHTGSSPEGRPFKLFYLKEYSHTDCVM